MNISTLGIDSYLKAVAGKMNAPTATRLLQFGTKKGFAGQALLRDNEGLYQTKCGILDAAQNHFAVTAGRDEFAVKMANFSVGQNQPSTGYEAVANVKTVGAIDLTIIARSQSIVPFVAVDRTMKNQVDTLFYMDLVALDSAGGVNAGDVVDGNFLPPNSNVKVDFTRSGSFKGGVCDAGCNIVPGSVRVSLKRDQMTPAGSQPVEVVGRDFDGQGIIYFPTSYAAKVAEDGSITMGDVNVGEATVDYDTGVITVKSGTDEKTTKVFYAVDNQANQEGKQTTRVAPQWRNVQLFATEDEIIVQDNLVNRLNMTKVQLLATEGAGGTSPADITFARTKNAYLEAINRKVLRKIVAAAKTPVIDFDLSKYALKDWNTTKNDQITQLLANMEAKYLGQTNVPLTAIITGSYGVALLQCIPNLWTPNPDAVVGLNGLAGYFNGKPVYRHNFLNAHAQTVKKGGNTPIRFYGIAKLPDNNAGSIVFGEYLPLTSTGVVSNFHQPVNVSTGFFSMTGAAIVDQNLIMMVQVIPPTATFGTEGVGEALVK